MFSLCPPFLEPGLPDTEDSTMTDPLKAKLEKQDLLHCSSHGKSAKLGNTKGMDHYEKIMKNVKELLSIRLKKDEKSNL